MFVYRLNSLLFLLSIPFLLLSLPLLFLPLTLPLHFISLLSVPLHAFSFLLLLLLQLSRFLALPARNTKISIKVRAQFHSIATLSTSLKKFSLKLLENCPHFDKKKNRIIDNILHDFLAVFIATLSITVVDSKMHMLSFSAA